MIYSDLLYQTVADNQIKLTAEVVIEFRDQNLLYQEFTPILNLAIFLDI